MVLRKPTPSGYPQSHQMKISWFVRQKAIKTMRVLSLFFIFITTLHSSENIFTNSQNKIGQIGYRLFIRFGAMMLSCVREFRLCSARFVWYLECRKLYGHFCRLHRAGGTEDVGCRPPILVQNWKPVPSNYILLLVLSSQIFRPSAVSVTEFSPRFKSIVWYAYMLGLILGIAYSLNSVQYFTSNPSKSRVIISTSVIYICKGH